MASSGREFLREAFLSASLAKGRAMRSVKFLLAAGAASLLSTAAFAADMPIAPPPMYAPPPADFGGWYLRGDIGFSNQRVKNVIDTNPLAYNNVAVSQTGSFGAAGIYDVGVGYRFNSWFRADFTAQYRGNSNFTGLDRVTGTRPFAGFYGNDNYTATKSELLFLANAYVDLGTWWCITPFVGAGIGTSQVTISNFMDSGVSNNNGTYFGGPPVVSSVSASSASQWNFAWAAHAGLAYSVSPSLTIELAYSYVNLGSGITGPTNSFDHATIVNGAPFSFHNISSNDLRLGVRWDLDTLPPPPPPPLVTKG
jgi:opacity protein-like surface antigen